MNGDAGNDTVFGSDDDDEIDGGAGNDSLRGDAGNDVISGDIGDDTISGGYGNDLLDGWAGNDSINGDDGIDKIYGGPGDDVIDAGIDVDSAWARNMCSVRRAMTTSPVANMGMNCMATRERISLMVRVELTRSWAMKMPT